LKNELPLPAPMDGAEKCGGGHRGRRANCQWHRGLGGKKNKEDEQNRKKKNFLLPVKKQPSKSSSKDGGGTKEKRPQMDLKGARQKTQGGGTRNITGRGQQMAPQPTHPPPPGGGEEPRRKQDRLDGALKNSTRPLKKGV